MAPIKVLIVDDSAVFRQIAKEILNADSAIEVVGVAGDPLFALERLKRTWPDVILLDVETPRLGGLAFLKKVMAGRPVPAVVACANLAGFGSEAARQALAAGAAGIIERPLAGLKDFLKGASAELVESVKTAAGANRPARVPRPAATPVPKSLPAQDGFRRIGAASTEAVVAMGTSTGGTQALEAVLTALPAACPGIVIVQHMPEGFTEMFAQRLDSLCQLEIREAKNGDRVVPGRVLVAPGGRQMTLRRNGAQYHVEVVDGPPVNRHRPSVDVLFRSVARVAGGNALGIIMTGMGDDGAQGLKEMHDAGARTVAEDESTCVVFGMPKEAIKLGGVDRVIPLEHIAGEILAFGRDFQTA